MWLTIQFTFNVSRLVSNNQTLTSRGLGSLSHSEFANYALHPPRSNTREITHRTRSDRFLLYILHYHIFFISATTKVFIPANDEISLTLKFGWGTKKKKRKVQSSSDTCLYGRVSRLEISKLLWFGNNVFRIGHRNVPIWNSTWTLWTLRVGQQLCAFECP